MLERDPSSSPWRETVALTLAGLVDSEVWLCLCDGADVDWEVDVVDGWLYSFGSGLWEVV
jgi:hypothetical protein